MIDAFRSDRQFRAARRLGFDFAKLENLNGPYIPQCRRSISREQFEDLLSYVPDGSDIKAKLHRHPTRRENACERLAGPQAARQDAGRTESAVFIFHLRRSGPLCRSNQKRQALP